MQTSTTSAVVCTVDDIVVLEQPRRKLNRDRIRVKMCNQRETKTTKSILALFFGLLTVILLGISLVSDHWVICIESFSNSDYSKRNRATFDIGLWSFCHTQHNGNYVVCADIDLQNLGEEPKYPSITNWALMDCIPSFIHNMRMSIPLICVGALLIALACISAIVGRCRYRSFILIACVLMGLGSIIASSGLFIFAIVLTDSTYRGTMFSHHEPMDYSYSWGFFSALLALVFGFISAAFFGLVFFKDFKYIEELVCASTPTGGRPSRLRPARYVLELHAPPRAPDLCEPAPDLCEQCEQDQEDMFEQDLEMESEDTVAEELGCRIQPVKNPPLCGLRYAEPPRPPAHYMGPDDVQTSV